MPRTRDGHPDLEGIWTNKTITPLERPKALGNKAFFTAAEAKASRSQPLSKLTRIAAAEAFATC